MAWPRNDLQGDTIVATDGALAGMLVEDFGPACPIARLL